MNLVCARLGCGHLAAASVQFNAEDSAVLIVDLGDSTVGIPLCGEHTRTRTPPVGWTMVDERSDPVQTPLWLEQAPPPAARGPVARPPVKRPADRGFLWERLSENPERESEDQPDNASSPSSPLLSRAFRTL